MKIKAVKFTKDGFMMKSFAFGGGLAKGTISPDEKMGYRRRIDDKKIINSRMTLITSEK